MKVYFINDTSDFANWGCRATSGALRNAVTDAGGSISHTMHLRRMEDQERYIPSSVGRRVVDAVRASTKRLPVLKITAGQLVEHMVTNRISRFYGERDIVPSDLADMEICAKYVLDGRICAGEREALESCDVVVINGEGSIYDRQRKGRMMLFIAYLAKRYFNKPCILVNHTVDLHDPVMSEMAQAVYPLLDDVVFREPISAEECVSILPDAMDRIAADVAFSYRPLEADHWRQFATRPGYFSVWPDSAGDFDPTQPYICVGGSSVYLRPDRPGPNPVPAFIKLCNELREAFGQVVLTAPCVADEMIFREVAEEMKLPLIGLHTPTQQAVDILGNASLYISGRWHPSILALTGGTPIIVLSANTRKTTGLLRLLEFESPTFDAHRIGDLSKEIIALAESYLGQGETLRSDLLARARKLDATTPRNVEWLTRHAGRFPGAAGTPSSAKLSMALTA